MNSKTKRGNHKMMLNLYRKKPVSIYMHEGCGRINIKFCNVQMKLKMCQFKLFNNYLINKSRQITPKTPQVELLLVQNNLTVTVSLKDFLQLMHGVNSVINKNHNLKN
tara:strand:- start:220 stop:543 length:324 start_codon:yes stop_codon:yes gene_type:complete